MRRTLGIFLAAVILLTASLGIVWAVVDSRGDQITYTENVLRGDVSAAEGITVDTRYEYQNHMVWFSRHRPAETMEATSTGVQITLFSPSLMSFKTPKIMIVPPKMLFFMNCPYYKSKIATCKVKYFLL